MSTTPSSAPWPNPMTSIRTFISRLFGSEAMATGTPPDPSRPLTPGLDAMQLAELIRSRFYADRHWARVRRDVWSARSTFLRVLLFALSLVGLVFLGIASLDGFAIVGFVCTTASTAIAALEGFFNWRSRWIASDAAIAQWHELEEALDLYVATTQVPDLDPNKILEFDDRRRSTWSELSNTWLSERRGARDSS